MAGVAPATYPSGLPGPHRWDIRPYERRARGSVRDPSAIFRARSLAFYGTVDAEFVFTSAQMATWDLWFMNDLVRGQRWFSQNVPMVKESDGWGVYVVRYNLDSLRYSNIGNGVYKLQCELEIRGEGDTGGSPLCTPTTSSGIADQTTASCAIAQ